MGAPRRESFEKEKRQAFVVDEDPPQPWRHDQPTSSAPLKSCLKETTTDSRHGAFTPSEQSKPVTNQHPPPVNTNINPAFGQNQIFTHHTHHPQTSGPFGCYPNNFVGAQTASGPPAGQIFVTPSSQPLLFSHPTQFPFGVPPIPATTSTPPFAPSGQAAGTNMGDYYRNSAPINQGASFQPQVPSTQNGPEIHYYYPRHDPPQFYQPGLQPAPGVGYALQQPGYVANVTAPMPAIIGQQPGMPAMMMPGAQAVPMAMPVGGPQMMAPAPVMMSGAMPVQGAAGNVPPFAAGAPAFHPDPVTGIGQTGQELKAAQVHFAYANNMFEPQDFKPADDDPSRYYFVREVDGEWTQRNRYTIDNLGDTRWYITDAGVFYAVRLPN